MSDFQLPDFIAHHFTSTPTPSAAAPATDVGPVAVLATDALLSAAAANLERARAGAKITQAWVVEGAARAIHDVKVAATLAPNDAAKIMRSRNALAATARASVATGERLLSVARVARVGSFLLSAAELLQVKSDNPAQTEQLERDVAEAKASGAWGCTTRLGFIQVCGPTNE